MIRLSVKASFIRNGSIRRRPGSCAHSSSIWSNRASSMRSCANSLETVGYGHITHAALQVVTVWIWISDGKSSRRSSDAIRRPCASRAGGATLASNRSHRGTRRRVLYRWPTRARRRWPSVRRRPASSTRRAISSASRSGRRAGTRQPAAPSANCSRAAPSSTATTASPAAPASLITCDMPSPVPGSTSMSDAVRISGTSRRVPAKTTRGPRHVP